MIIRTNLYAPEMEQPRAPVITPVRLAVTAGIMLVAFLAVQSLVLYREVQTLRLEVAAQSSIEEPIRQKLEGARTRAIALSKKIQKRQAIMGCLNGRVNWAPVLERIYSAIPDDVQLSELRLSHNEKGACVVLLNGRAAGNQPRIEADKCRVILLDALQEIAPAAIASFISLDDADQTVHRDGQEMPVAKFSIQISWVDHANGN